jgi:iron complex transport system substrate-binding protein
MSRPLSLIWGRGRFAVVVLRYSCANLSVFRERRGAPRSQRRKWIDRMTGTTRNSFRSSSSRISFALAFLALICALLLAACGSSGATGGTSTGSTKPLLEKDANGTAITIPATPPQRIVSLTAGNSEMLAAMGAGSRIVAVDSTTNYPTDLADKPKVSDPATGAVNVEQVVALKPDLVLSWNHFSGDADQKLMQAGVTVIDLPGMDLSGTLTEMRLVGQLTHEEKTANALVDGLQKRIDAVKSKVASAPPLSVYMEVGYTPAPPYAFGAGSFGDEVIKLAGGMNIFGTETSGGGYPAVSDERIIAANPTVIILTEDPAYGGDPQAVGKRPGWADLAAVKNGKVYAINPDPIQRPGPRLVDALEQVAKLLHPGAFS